MKNLIIIPIMVLSLGACSNTLHGLIDDSSDNSHKAIDVVGDAVVKVVDWTGNVVTTVGEDAVSAGSEIASDAVVDGATTDIPSVPDAPGNSGNAPGQNKVAEVEFTPTEPEAKTSGSFFSKWFTAE